MKRIGRYSRLALTTALLALPFSHEALARGGVYFSGAVIGAPAYYPYPPYYPAYPYYAYRPPVYAYTPYAYAPPPYPAYAAPPVAAPVVGGVGVGVRIR